MTSRQSPYHPGRQRPAGGRPRQAWLLSSMPLNRTTKWPTRSRNTAIFGRKWPPQRVLSDILPPAPHCHRPVTLHAKAQEQQGNPKMLVPSLVERIRCLLSEKSLSQREISRRLGVSRGTVGAIARGTRLDGPRRRSIKPIVEPGGRPKRCRSCGALVRLPCLRCQLHALRGSVRGNRR